MRAVIQRVSPRLRAGRRRRRRRDRRGTARAARRRAERRRRRRGRRGWPGRSPGCGSSRTTTAASTVRCSTPAAPSLAVSQFTLIADTAKGNRPSFAGAAAPGEAERLYERFCAALRDLGVAVRDGRLRRPDGGRARQRRAGDDRPRRRRGAGVKRVLLTGMSGTGKSSVVEELVARGYKAVDTDDGFCDVQPDGRQLWREDAIRAAARDRGRRRPLPRRLRGEPGDVPPAVRPHRPPERAARDDGRAAADEDEQPVRQVAARAQSLPRGRRDGRAAAAPGGRSRGADDRAAGRASSPRSCVSSALSSAALALALGAAILHAVWNLLLAGSRDVLAATAVALCSSLVIALPFAAATWGIERAAIPWLVASGALELVYFLTLTAAYQRAELSLVYPLARGGAPVLVLLGAVVTGYDAEPDRGCRRPRRRGRRRARARPARRRPPRGRARAPDRRRRSRPTRSSTRRGSRTRTRCRTCCSRCCRRRSVRRS